MSNTSMPNTSMHGLCREQETILSKIGGPD